MNIKKINEEINEIRSLMNINEEIPFGTLPTFGTQPAGLGLLQGIKNFFNPEDAPEDSKFHRQTFIETGKNGLPIGYFVPNMMVGKCYEYSKINISDPVWKIMGLDILGFTPGEDLFEDEDGAYIKPSLQSPIRIYLPKKSWFDQFSDSIFTIKEVAECDKPNKYEIYRLLFQLKDPNAAIKSLQITKEGILPVGSVDTENRGWDVYSTFKSSGYFKVKNTDNIQESTNKTTPLLEQYNWMGGSNVIQPTLGADLEAQNKARAEKENAEKLMKLMNTNPISSLEEYEWSDIEEKAGKSDFDIWYDSSSGTLISIGIAILLGVVTGGWSVALTAGIESAVLATTARVAIVVGTEAIIGVPESIYLYDRGMESQAGLIIFMCLIPAFGELGRFNRLIKKPASFDDAVETLTRKYQAGEMKSPAQFKQWLDGIKATDAVLYKYITDMLPLAENTAKYGTKTLERQIYAGLDKAFKSIDALDIGKAYRHLNGVQRKLILNNSVPKAWPSTLKMLGFSLGSAAVGGIIFVVFFSSDSELGKPSELKARVDDGISTAQTKLGVKIVDPLRKQIEKLIKEIGLASNSNQWDLFYQKTNELLLIYKDLCRIGVEDVIVPTKLLSDTILNAYEKSLLTYAIDVQKKQSGVINSITVPVLEQDKAKEKILNGRQDLPNADNSFFVDKTKVCEFISWCYMNYNTTHEWYMNVTITVNKEAKQTKAKFTGIFGGKTPPDEKISKTICENYLNPTTPDVIKFELNEFLGHPFMKCLWYYYGTSYKNLTKSSCNKPGFVQITKSSEIGIKDETKYEYCSSVDDKGKTIYFRKPR